MQGVVLEEGLWLNNKLCWDEESKARYKTNDFEGLLVELSYIEGVTYLFIEALTKITTYR